MMTTKRCPVGMILRWGGLLGAALVGCARPHLGLVSPLNDDWMVWRQRLDVADVGGFSDLTADESGRLWTVAERDPVLLAIKPAENEGEYVISERVSLSGVSRTVDAESLAYLGADTWAIGTEGRERGRHDDLIYIAKRSDDAVRVVDTINFPYDLWSMTADRNKGIEALCYVDGELWVSNENVVISADKESRLAPLGRLPLAARAWQRYWLRLTSRAGKISAMTCNNSADGRWLELIAVERHYGIARIVRGCVDRTLSSGEIELEPVVDLAAYLLPLPNLEGIVVLPDQRYVLISDNQMFNIQGPTEVVTAVSRSGSRSACGQ